MSDPRSHPHGSGAQPPDGTHPAEIVEAEVVDERVEHRTPDDATTTPADDEERRRYQEFLEFQEFQRFREWQRTQAEGGADPRPPRTAATRTKKPWWKHLLGILRFKLVRRLLYLLLFIILLPYLVNYAVRDVLGTGGSGGGDGTGGGAPPGSTTQLQTDPQDAVRSVYTYLASTPAIACEMFDESGKAAFALAYGAPDCATAARKIHDQVTSQSYRTPEFPEDAIETTATEAVAHGCRIKSAGGPPLGSFKLKRQANGGWIITAYNPQCQ
ncbi:hypothetical protein [Saccharopolyspora rosea]|uniref:hypothetical protein n=1 Tax=Saccharopolyspora rosea TaxID=524884 RepID=UPI0021DA0A2F|nr:hypothetical protein [Saccharopolyspora rosea]